MGNHVIGLGVGENGGTVTVFDNEKKERAPLPLEVVMNQIAVPEATPLAIRNEMKSLMQAGVSENTLWAYHRRQLLKSCLWSSSKPRTWGVQSARRFHLKNVGENNNEENLEE